MKVRDLVGARNEVYSIPEEMSVHEAARYLRDRQVRSTGVTNAVGKVVGVVSQSDISDQVAAENKCPAWMKVSEIMTRELISVAPEATLEECLRLMEKNGVYHLLVVDEDETFRGMLSVSDLLRVMVSDEKERADLLEAILFPAH